MEIQASFNRQIDQIQQKLRECNEDCNRLKRLVREQLAPLESASLLPPAAEPQPETILSEPLVPEEKPVDQSPVVLDTPLSKTPELVQESPALPPPIPPIPVKTDRPPVRPPVPAKPARQRERGSLEKFIGENLLNKIGIGILVVGIGIFVKYAIDQDWIGPVGRVLVGLATGGILLGLAHRLRKAYAAFSSVLVGGGIATLYFTVGIAYHTYALLPQTLAFGLMCAITAFGVVMAVGYDRKEIAVLSVLGGFGTPFMVSNGEGNYIALFSYLVVLNLGMLALSWMRRWPIVRILSYAMTILVYGGWLLYNHLDTDTPEIAGNLLFGLVFFLIFFASHIAFAVRKQEKLRPVDFILVLSNSGLFYAAIMFILYFVEGGRYQGIFTALMGVFHFAFVFPARKWVHFDRRLVTVLVGSVLTFVTLAVPIQMEGAYMTLFWAVEAVVVLLLSGKTGLKVLERASYVLAFLAAVSIFRDWFLFYVEDWGGRPSPLFNGAFVTTVVTAGSLIVLRAIHLRRSGTGSEPVLASLLRFVAFPLLYIGLLLETIEQLETQVSIEAALFGAMGVTAGYLAALSILAYLERNKVFGATVLGIGLLAIGLLTVAQTSFVAEIRSDYLNGMPEGAYFAWHLPTYIGAILFLLVSYFHGQRHYGKDSFAGVILHYVLPAFLVLVCSFELENALAFFGVAPETTRKAGFPILWGLIGFGLVAWGMRKQVRDLRLAGLALFLLIVVKLFVYDIRAVSTGGKIAAFISLGVLLLVVSFMYQRLKKLLVDEAPEEEETP